MENKTFQKLAADLGVELYKAMEIAKWVRKETMEISLCPHCYCMTKNICGKCNKIKEE